MIRLKLAHKERLPRPITRLEEAMEDLMDRLFHPEEGWWVPSGEFTPRANVVESDEGFEVTVDLPGMEADEVDVEISNGSLWISGERKEEKEERGKTYHQIERRYGEFRRVIPLGATVNEENVEAAFKDGVLTITVPKMEEAKPKHIEVKT